MPDAVTNFAAIGSSDAISYFIAQQMFSLSEKKLVLGRFAKRHNLPQRNGKTLRVVRYDRLNLPTAPLTEGTPPDAVALSVGEVDVTVEQWGIVVLLTDVALITTKHPALQVAIDRTSLVMSELLEREMANTLLDGSSDVIFGGDATSRADIVAADVFNTTVALKAVVNLRSKGAPTFEGDLYGAVIHPQVEGDLPASDATFRDISGFANVRKFEAGEIGVWMGIRWTRGNFLPKFKGVPAPSAAAATTEKAQATDAGAGGAFGAADITVVAREVTTGYERKISGEYTTAAGADSVTIVAPSSTAYVYDIYSTGDGGAGAYKLVASGVAASSSTVIDTTDYTAGTVASPPAPPADQVEVFPCFVIGRDAFGRVELDGMSLQSYITPAGPSWSNPLAQGRKVGSKLMWKSFTIDPDFYVRIEVGSAFPALLPA